MLTIVTCCRCVSPGGRSRGPGARSHSRTPRAPAPSRWRTPSHTYPWISRTCTYYIYLVSHSIIDSWGDQSWKASLTLPLREERETHVKMVPSMLAWEWNFRIIRKWIPCQHHRNLFLLGSCGHALWSKTILSDNWRTSFKALSWLVSVHSSELIPGLTLTAAVARPAALQDLHKRGGHLEI